MAAKTLVKPAIKRLELEFELKTVVNTKFKIKDGAVNSWSNANR
jgi:hypothetical protein